MKEIIGVRFRPNGKIYYFDPQNFEVEAGSFVIVETARGVEYGKVVLGRREVEEGKITASLKPIIRIATEDDTRRYEDNKKKSKRAFGICLEKIAKHKLDMKLIEAEYTFDNNKVLAESAYVEGSSAVTSICRSSFQYQSRWQRSRTCH